MSALYIYIEREGQRERERERERDGPSVHILLEDSPDMDLTVHI